MPATSKLISYEVKYFKLNIFLKVEIILIKLKFKMILTITVIKYLSINYQVNLGGEGSIFNIVFKITVYVQNSFLMIKSHRCNLSLYLLYAYYF